MLQAPSSSSSRYWFIPLLLACVAMPGFTQPAADSGWVDLTVGGLEQGWRQLGGAAEYTLEDGVVVGTAVIETPNSFLATTEEYGDFALQLEFKVDEGLNAGIQIRSHSDPDYWNGVVHGYQVEIDPSERAWSGGIYDEARRGWLFPLSLNPAARQAFRQGDWNHVYIEAIGSEIRTWLNDVPATYLIDEMTPSGFVALQVHSVGPEQGGLQVRYRNVWLRTEDLAPSGRSFPYVVDTRANQLSEAEAAKGWELLFDGESTEAWRGAHREDFPGTGWEVRDGELTVLASESDGPRGGGIVTRETFSAFELQLEFRMTEGANSGIKYLVTEGYDSAPGTAIAFEYQILDDMRHADAEAGRDGNRTLASLYDLLPATKTGRFVHGPGRYNHARIVVRADGTVEHWLNHQLVLAFDRNSAELDEAIALSKFAGRDGFGKWPEGRILLQDHGDEVAFRSIKVRRLDAAK
ncbi:MAG: DUF1080 domain-containing protein [Holophagales bacterium]|nr:DUF1080 domain-containing protein [Holophagales bacterium]MYC08834.1 DUF1080 domain-containing protein [Holophagales bacterium]